MRFEPGSEVENAAVRLVLKSDRMGQTLERWLAVAPSAYGQMDMGPAQLQIMKAEDMRSLDRALSVPSRSTEMAANGLGQLVLSWKGVSETVSLSEATNQVVRLDAGDMQLTAEVTGFWPDFRLDANRQPTTASQQLRNPAIQLQLTVGESVAPQIIDQRAVGQLVEQPSAALQTERWFVFARPEFDAIQTQSADEPIDLTATYTAPSIANGTIADKSSDGAFFRVVVDAAGKLHYAANSSKGFVSGALAVGETVVPGWADFSITLAEYIPNAQVRREIVPLPEGAPEQGEPALLVATDNGQPAWIPWGQPTTVSSADGDWYAAFTPKLLQLPFSLKLNDFIVERNEGSESVAMWTSAVSLFDPHKGQQVARRVWMNHPTWFKGWKIAQASWNPGDLNQSTLQIKREPWWVTGLTWLGSMMVTVGIATMFYGRSVAKQLKVASKLLTPSEESEKVAEPIPLVGFFLGR